MLQVHLNVNADRYSVLGTGNSFSLDLPMVLVPRAVRLVTELQMLFSVSESAVLGSAFYFSWMFRSLMAHCKCFDSPSQLRKKYVEETPLFHLLLFFPHCCQRWRSETRWYSAVRVRQQHRKPVCSMLLLKIGLPCLNASLAMMNPSSCTVQSSLSFLIEVPQNFSQLPDSFLLGQLVNHPQFFPHPSLD